MTKRAVCRRSHPGQVVLPGCRLWDFVRDTERRRCDCAADVMRVGVLLCVDAPWECPRGVPPTSNTGVHATVKRGSVGD